MGAVRKQVLLMRSLRAQGVVLDERDVDGLRALRRDIDALLDG